MNQIYSETSNKMLVSPEASHFQTVFLRVAKGCGDEDLDEGPAERSA